MNLWQQLKRQSACLNYKIVCLEIQLNNSLFLLLSYCQCEIAFIFPRTKYCNGHCNIVSFISEILNRHFWAWVFFMSLTLTLHWVCWRMQFPIQYSFWWTGEKLGLDAGKQPLLGTARATWLLHISPGLDVCPPSTRTLECSPPTIHSVPTNTFHTVPCYLSLSLPFVVKPQWHQWLYFPPSPIPFQITISDPSMTLGLWCIVLFLPLLQTSSMCTNAKLWWQPCSTTENQCTGDAVGHMKC